MTDIEKAQATVSLFNAVRRCFTGGMTTEEIEAHVKATLAQEAIKAIARRSRKPKENGKPELFTKQGAGA